MLNPDFRLALAVAHIEDLQREAARRQAVRLARRVAGKPRVGGLRSPDGDPRPIRHADPVCPAPRPGTTTGRRPTHQPAPEQAEGR